MLCVSRAARNLTSHKTFEPFLPLQRILFDCYFGCGYNHRHHHHESSASERERERVKNRESEGVILISNCQGPLPFAFELVPSISLCVFVCVRCELGERDYYVGSLQESQRRFFLFWGLFWVWFWPSATSRNGEDELLSDAADIVIMRSADSLFIIILPLSSTTSHSPRPPPLFSADASTFSLSLTYSSSSDLPCRTGGDRPPSVNHFPPFFVFCFKTAHTTRRVVVEKLICRSTFLATIVPIK